MLGLFFIGSGGRGRGRGKRKFAPQGSWRQQTQGYQDDGAAWFPVFQRPHAIPFSSLPPAAASGGGKQSLVEKAWQLWGAEGDSVYSVEVINAIFQNVKKSE